MPDHYTAQSDAPGHVIVSMPGCQYGMDTKYARALMHELKLAINAAELICDDCGIQNSSVERSGCPDAIKHGDGQAATLCDACFHIRDQITQVDE